MRTVIEKTALNDTELYYSITSSNNENPLLLYLHGGPGDACIPLTEKYNSDLGENFIFVNLEQRGCGLSYYKFNPEEKLNIDTMVEDIHSFVLFLLDKFRKKQLILVGHSGGTVLGIYFIRKYPEYISHYVGIGQVVNMEKNILTQIDFIQEKEKIASNFRVDKSTIATVSLDLTRKVVKHGGSLHGKKNYSMLSAPFIFSRRYTLLDLIHRLQGSRQSIDTFWKELLSVNFEPYTHFAIPVTFIEGRHNYHVSSLLVEDYEKTIQSESRIIWFEQSGHFPQWEESDLFNLTVKELFTPIVD